MKNNVRVDVHDDSNEAFEKAFSVFKKKCNKDTFLRETKERRYYRKPSEVKREKKRIAKRMQAKNENKRNRD